MIEEFDIQLIISKLKEKRKIFVSEADFQFELAWTIKEKYPEAKVRLEYCPVFDPNIHIDILVIIDNKWIPIELKYKTKGCKKIVDNEEFNLKNQGANDVGCYRYLKDIQRIEDIRDKVKNFKKGYTIFITNDLGYTKNPRKPDCVYKQFSLKDKITKSGKLKWSENTSAGTKKGCEDAIELKDKYPIKWNLYYKIDDGTNTGIFMYLVNEIKK